MELLEDGEDLVGGGLGRHVVHSAGREATDFVVAGQALLHRRERDKDLLVRAGAAEAAFPFVLEVTDDDEGNALAIAHKDNILTDWVVVLEQFLTHLVADDAD